MSLLPNPINPTPRRIAALGLTAALGLGLAGCAEARGHEFPADNSPSLEAVSSAFTDIKLGEIALTPYSAGASEQLLQQSDITANAIRDGHATVDPKSCVKPLIDSLSSRSLRWDSIYATSPEEDRVAHLYLAPSTKLAEQTVAQVKTNLEACPSSTVIYQGRRTVTSTELMPTSEKNAVAYTQQMTTQGRSYALVTYYIAHRNAVMSVSVQNLSKKPAEIVDMLEAYAKKYLEVLDPHFTAQ